MKRCYLVTGPESAGNRLLGAILMRAGCEGRIRGELPTDEDPSVLIRSFRHEGYNLHVTLSHLDHYGYTTTILMPVRHPLAMLRSQYERGHVERYGEGTDSYRDGYLGTLRTATYYGVAWWLVPYESLETGSAALCEMLGLEPGDGPLPVLSAGFYDQPGNENAKHW